MSPIDFNNIPLAPIDNSYAGTRDDILIIDQESNFQGQVVEIAIIDTEGMPILISPIDPIDNQGFKHAGKQLPMRLLSKSPTLVEITPMIEEITASKTCVFWNAKYDVSCLPNCFSRSRSIVCAMERVSMLNGDYCHYFGSYKNISLSDAIELLNLDWPAGVRHRASTDAEALRRIWNWLQKKSLQSLLSLTEPVSRDLDNFF
mgnify:CR=1 FL=1